MPNIKGITRNTDSEGRVCLPIAFRRGLGMSERDKLEFVPKENKILIQISTVKNDIKGDERKLDGLGRAVIPSELRKKYGITENTELDIYPYGSSIAIETIREKCRFCGGAK